METFDNLPQAVAELQQTVNEIKRLLLEKSNSTQPQPDTLLTVQEAAKFLTLSVPTIYALTSKGRLPTMKVTKRCYFSRFDLMEYIKAGRKKTVSEIEAETDSFLSNHKRKGGNHV